MSSYASLSKFYDKLMGEDFDYEKIADFIENLFDKYDINPELVCDLACGTGNITIPLAKRGYDMIGIDKSFDMLDMARKKARDKGISDILFLNQNMTKPDLYGTVDAFLCMIDGINYVINPRSLFDMFAKIKKCFLNPDGLFVFDISSEYKLKNILGNNTFVYDTDEIFYTWENRYFEKKHLSDMCLTFFEKTKSGKYSRFTERHLQRAYSPLYIKKLLIKAGFKRVDIFDGMSFNDPTPESQRILFVAK